MINKQFILGTVLGIFIGVSSSSFAFFRVHDSVALTELTAGGLKAIVNSAVDSAIGLHLEPMSKDLSYLKKYCSY